MRSRTRPMFLAMLLLIGCTAASPVGAVQVVAGGKGGFTNTDLVGANDDAISTKNSGLVGIILGWQINPWFAMHFEPDVSQKGADLKGYSFGDLPTSLKMTYVELPVLAKFKYSTPSGSRGGPFGTVGPSVGISTQAKATYAGDETNFNQQVQDIDLGISLGAGYDLPAGGGVATLEVRYVFGLLDVFETSAPRPEITGDLKNRALQVTVGWFAGIF